MQNKIRELYKVSQENQVAESMMGQNGQPLYPGLNYNRDQYYQLLPCLDGTVILKYD